MIKQILRKLIYREKSSGEKYIAYCKRGGGQQLETNFRFAVRKHLPLMKQVFNTFLLAIIPK